VIRGSASNLPDHIRLGVGGVGRVKLEMGLTHLARLLSDWPVQ